jgi:hypothetical protein
MFTGTVVTGIELTGTAEAIEETGIAPGEILVRP